MKHPPPRRPLSEAFDDFFLLGIAFFLDSTRWFRALGNVAHDYSTPENSHKPQAPSSPPAHLSPGRFSSLAASQEKASVRIFL